MEEKITAIIQAHYEVDAIYLYGSRAKGLARPDSDWDIAILFQQAMLDDIAAWHLRPQTVKALLEKQLDYQHEINVVDLELVPVPLQYNIIRAKELYTNHSKHYWQVENGIVSKIELDYPQFSIKKDDDVA